LVELDRAGLGAHVDEVAHETLAVDVHVPAAKLGRHLTQVILERRLPLVEDEPDATDGEDQDGELEPHATRIGNPGLFV